MAQHSKGVVKIFWSRFHSVWFELWLLATGYGVAAGMRRCVIYMTHTFVVEMINMISLQGFTSGGPVARFTGKACECARRYT